jgi:hypothetical protein
MRSHPVFKLLYLLRFPIFQNNKVIAVQIGGGPPVIVQRNYIQHYQMDPAPQSCRSILVSGTCSLLLR